jgi:hypothetical protein
MRCFYLKSGERKCGLHNHKRCSGIVDEILYCTGNVESVVLAIIGSLCRKCGRRVDLIPQKEMESWPIKIDTSGMKDEEFANFIKGL